MTNAATLGSFGDASNAPLVFRNKIINGGFDIWQRGTSQTSSGYGSDDRWSNLNSGSTKTASQQTFTRGQTDVPGNPRYFSRTVVSTVAGSGNYAYKLQPIESVATLSGQTATLSFWAKADASKNMAVEFVQNFGTGGSPTAAVTGIGVTTCALTTSWKYFTVTVSIPSISASTLGTNNNDYLGLDFWFDAGSTFNARTNSLGQQSGTFDIAQVQLEAGNAATPFEQRPIGMELSLCQRYYEQWSAGDAYAKVGLCVAGSTTTAIIIYNYKQDKRISSVALTYGGSWQLTLGTFTSFSISSDGKSTSTGNIDITGTGFTSGAAGWVRSNNSTASYIGFSAEL